MVIAKVELSVSIILLKTNVTILTHVYYQFTPIQNNWGQIHWNHCYIIIFVGLSSHKLWLILASFS